MAENMIGSKRFGIFKRSNIRCIDWSSSLVMHTSLIPYGPTSSRCYRLVFWHSTMPCIFKTVNDLISVLLDRYLITYICMLVVFRASFFSVQLSCSSILLFSVENTSTKGNYILVNYWYCNIVWIMKGKNILNERK